jgi:sec-independent protein translocase protein TatB
MFFDIGWPELMLVGVVALVVIGPKDLPRALRVAGFWVRKARTLSREFQNSIDQMIREAELDEVRQELKKASEFNLENEIRNTVDPTGELEHSLKTPPHAPDFFLEAEGPSPESEPALEALPEAVDAAEPEQAMLPFDEPEPAPAASPHEEEAAAAPAGEAAPAAKA